VKAMSTLLIWNLSTFELSGVVGDGMSDTMGQAARCGTIGALETSDKDLTHA
jgi:hypothetical protein